MNKYQEAHDLGGRFVSEFGMIAHPHLSTIRRMASSPSQLYPGSMVLDFHNKAIGNHRRMATYVAENFREQSGLAAVAHLTQIVQAETMRAAYKAWRRDWGSPRARKCGGALVWQLNDCWPTTSWAVVDYFLVKKPAYYAIARALRPLDVGVSRTYFDWTQTGYLIDENSGLVTGQVDQTLPARPGARFDVWVASARLGPIDVDLRVRFVSVRTGRDVAPAVERRVTAAPNGTTEAVAGEALPASIPDAEDATRAFDTARYDPFVVHATLSVDGAVVAEDTAWPDPVKFLDLSDRGVRFELSPSRIVVSAERPVKGFVFEETEGMKLSDNGFDLVPGDKHIIEVEGVAADKLKYTFIDAPGASLEIS